MLKCARNRHDQVKTSSTSAEAETRRTRRIVGALVHARGVEVYRRMIVERATRNTPMSWKGGTDHTRPDLSCKMDV